MDKLNNVVAEEYRATMLLHTSTCAVLPYIPYAEIISSERGHLLPSHVPYSAIIAVIRYFQGGSWTSCATNCLDNVYEALQVHAQYHSFHISSQHTSLQHHAYRNSCLDNVSDPTPCRSAS